MKKLIVGLCLAGATVTAGAETVGELVAASAQANAAYNIAVAERELAQLEYESDVALADSLDEEDSAELALLQARSSHQQSVESFVDDTLYAVFDVATTSLNLQAAELSMENSRVTLLAAETRHESGEVSDSDLESAGLDHRESENSLAQTEFNYHEALANLQFVTGLEWDSDTLPGEPTAPDGLNAAAWVEADLSYQQAIIRLVTAERAANNPTGAVALNDQRAAEIALESATLDLQLARESAEQAFRRELRTLESESISLQIQADRLELQRRLLDVEHVRLDRGMITESDYRKQQVQVLSAEVSYLQALQSAIETIVEISIHLGLSIDLI